MAPSKHLQDLLSATGRALGRSKQDTQPFLKLLEENWYDTVKSLRDCSTADLQELGIPQRFAKELKAQVDKEDAKDRGKGKSKGKAQQDAPRRDRDRDEVSKSSGGPCFVCDGPHFARECPVEKAQKGKGKGKEKGKGKGGKGTDDQRGTRPSQREYAFKHKITFDIEEIDETFPLAARLIGKGGRNVQHIRQSTGAWVWLCGRGSSDGNEHHAEESDEPIHVLVCADEQKSLDEAINITNDLVDTVLEQYSEYVASKGESIDGEPPLDDSTEGSYERGSSGQKGKGKSKGKSKGKGKGKSKSKSRRDDRDAYDEDDDERPSKRNKRD